MTEYYGDPRTDTGCKYCPSCLNCIFPKCLEEVPWYQRNVKQLARAQKVFDMREGGMNLSVIARKLGISDRTAQRDLQICNNLLTAK